MMNLLCTVVVCLFRVHYVTKCYSTCMSHTKVPLALKSGPALQCIGLELTDKDYHNDLQRVPGQAGLIG